MSTPQVSPGTVVDGRYTVGGVVRSRLGATSCSATDPAGIPVEVTIYGPECFASALVLERSLRELRQLHNVSSDRVLAVQHCGRHGDGIFEVTDPAPAQSLEVHLAAGSLSAPDAAGIIVQVGEGLLEAQKVGVIHRNLGAGVVFPSPDGVLLSGFAVGEPQAGPSFGALHTMAPEQVEGKVVDQRTLIYNLAALMHWMLTGSPLFGGDTVAVLDQHVNAEPPVEVHTSLRRALGKDPRLRPMMLKQFLGELAAIGGLKPPTLRPSTSKPPSKPRPSPSAAPIAGAGSAPSRPSERGWTMFTKDEEGGEAKGAEAPAAPKAVSPPGAKPSTRGWTMFMQAVDDDAPPKSEPAPTPGGPPSESPAAEGGGEGAKPSTRGWTMFMQAQDEAAASSTNEGATPPATDEQASKPSTRGWTMFMTDEEGGGDAPGGDAQTPAAPEPEAPVKPSTRGWTMFMNEEGTEPAPGAQPPSAPGAPQAAAPDIEPLDMDLPAPPAALETDPVRPPDLPPAQTGSTLVPPGGGLEPTEGAHGFGADGGPPPDAAAEGDPGAPTQRGWTMFTEPKAPIPAPPPSGVQTGAAPPEAEPGVPTDPTAARTVETPRAPSTVETPVATLEPVEGVAEPVAPAAAAAPGPPRSGEKKRGWTMFMEAPIADAAKAGLGGPGRPPQAQAQQGQDAPSDTKGWTVFGEPAQPRPSEQSTDPGAPVGPVPASPDAPTANLGPRPVDEELMGPPVTGAPYSAADTPPGGLDLNLPEPPRPEAPASAHTVISNSPPLQRPNPDPTAIPLHPEPEAPAAAGPGPASRGKTVITHGVHSAEGASGSVTGRTVFPGIGQSVPGDTQYYQSRPEQQAARAARAVTARDLQPPSGGTPVLQSGRSSVAPGRQAPIAVPQGGKGKVVAIAVGAAVAVGLLVAAFFAFT